MSTINQIDIAYIIEIAVFIGLANVGIIQLFKNFLKKKRGKLITLISLVITAALCVLNSDLVPPIVTTLVDLIAIAISISQLAWDILAQAVPKAVGHFVDKVVGAEKEKREEAEAEE